jgi:predicted dehydrogenase
MMLCRLTDSEWTENTTALVSISMVEAGNYRNTVEFFGTKGAIRVEDSGEVYIANIKENVWEEIEFDLGDVAPGMQVGGWSRGFTAFSRRVVEAVRAGSNYVKDAATFDDGYRIQLVLDAARRSNETGETVKVWA